MLPNWLYGKSKSKLATIFGGGGGTPADYNQVKAQVNQNTEDISNLSDALDGKAALTQISNPNLLDNPWFTVNQRGNLSYTGNGVYTFDRWSINGENAAISKDSSTGALTFSTTAQYSPLIQKFPSDYLEVGKTYTLSAMFSDGVIESYTFTAVDGNSPFRQWQHAPSFNALITNEYSNQWQVFIFDYLSASGTTATVSFKAVKLELGSVSTLAMDAAPNYATELLKCQRYFHKYATEALRPSNMYDCVPEMRATPTQSTITIDGTTYYVNSADL